MNKTGEETVMNEELYARLVRDLSKSGFHSEMRAIQACTEAGWECRGSFTYFDKDERATRECDFGAVRTWREVDDGSNIQAIARLVGQVKKSEAPWIVFVDRQPKLSDGWDNIITTSAPEANELGEILRHHSFVDRNGWAGTGIHEAFKKPTDASRWYSAFVTVCKAAESAFDSATTANRPHGFFELIKPIVVLDGCLVAAELSADGEPLLTAVPGAAFPFEYRSDAYERPRYCLDLVTLNAFPRYLDLVANRMVGIRDALAILRKRG